MADAWRSLANLVSAKEAHREKSKGYLTDIIASSCLSAGDVNRQQLKDFNEWFEDWGYTCPSCQEEADIEQAMYAKMVKDDNKYLHKWQSSRVWQPAVVLPFCTKCALWHGRVSWCN